MAEVANRAGLEVGTTIQRDFDTGFESAHLIRPVVQVADLRLSEASVLARPEDAPLKLGPLSPRGA